MQMEVLSDGNVLAKRAAQIIAADARSAVEARAKFIMAVSGGKSPWLMLADLVNEDVPWKNIHIFQIDERIAPPGDPDRNYTHLRASLLKHVPIPEQQIYPMPVNAPDLNAAAREYQQTLEAITGKPAALDLAHLGIGTNGHTASLLPDDPVLDVVDADVAITTQAFEGHRRMTMTFPMINRSRKIMWLIVAANKAEMLRRLQAGDKSIPAGRISQSQALILADRAAAGE